MLKSNGYDVMEASNGRAALAAYEKNAHKVDMVLTDVVMPQMSGFELGKQLGERSPGLKILYMSGYRDNAHRRGRGDVAARLPAQAVHARHIALESARCFRRGKGVIFRAVTARERCFFGPCFRFLAVAAR